MQRLIIDVDSALGVEGGDIDDAYLLALVAGHLDKIKIEGVTVAAGNVSLPSASKSTRLVCELCGIYAEVAEGTGKPLDRDLVTGHSGLAKWADPNEKWIFTQTPRGAVASFSATDLILRKAAEGPIEILATAPLTNIATLLRDHPQVKSKIIRIVTMGGFFVGNKRGPEFNIKTDPLAAKIVYESGVPMVVIPLEQTTRTNLTEEQTRAWKDLGTAGRLFYEGTVNWINVLHSAFGAKGCHIHDPLAAAYLFHPDLFQIKGIIPRIDVTTGQTDVEKWDETSPVKLVTDFNVERFHRVFLDTVAGVFRSHA